MVFGGSVSKFEGVDVVADAVGGARRTRIRVKGSGSFTSIAAHARKSMNQTVAELIRRGLAQPALAADASANPAMRVDKHTGLPVIRSPRPVTVEDVRALEDE